MLNKVKKGNKSEEQKIITYNVEMFYQASEYIIILHNDCAKISLSSRNGGLWPYGFLP